MSSTNDYYQIPADISAIYLDNTYAQISFTTPSTVVNPNYYYHVVVYDASGNYYDASGTSSPITVSGLTRSTTYSCYVELIQYSTSIIVVKRTLPWPKIYTIYISDVSYSSLNVSWTGIDISYLTVSRRIGSVAAAATDISTSTVYYTTYNDTDISGNTVYYYYVTPYLPYDGVVNTGSASATVSTTTLPAPPTALTSSFYDSSSAIVSFTPARNSYSSSYYYILRATSATGYIDTSGTSSPIQALELSGNTAYTLRVISAIDNSAALYATSTTYVERTTLVRPPSGVAVSTYDSSGITLSYSAGKNTYSTIYYTLYASTGGYYTTISGSTTALSLTDLSGNTEYTLSIANTLNGNTSLSATTVYGSQLTLTQPPKSVYKTYVDSSAITVAFTAGTNKYTSVVYTATGTDIYGGTKTGTTTTVVPFSMTDLSGNTKYTVTVSATLDGNSALTATSAAISQWTYVQSPTELSAAVDGSSVAVSFSSPKNSYATAVYYVASATDGINTTDASGTTNVLLIQGLSASTNYSYYVKTVVSARSSVGSVTTYNPYPTITSISASDVSYNFVNINWAGTDISYVRISRRIGSAAAASYTDISYDYATPYPDADLSGNTVYYYYITPIRVYKGVVKTGTASSVISATTSVAPPKDVSAIYYDYSGVLISFTEPKNSYSTDYYYTVRATDGSGNYRDVSGTTSPINVANLSSLTSYSFYVRVSIDGSSNLTASSGSISVKTTYNYAYFNGLVLGVTRFG